MLDKSRVRLEVLHELLGHLGDQIIVAESTTSLHGPHNGGVDIEPAVLLHPNFHLVLFALVHFAWGSSGNAEEEETGERERGEREEARR